MRVEASQLLGRAHALESRTHHVGFNPRCHGVKSASTCKDAMLVEPPVRAGAHVRRAVISPEPMPCPSHPPERRRFQPRAVEEENNRVAVHRWENSPDWEGPYCYYYYYVHTSLQLRSWFYL